METAFSAWADTDAGKWSNVAWAYQLMERVRIDPYLIWADVTKFAYLSGGKEALAKIPVILELKTSAQEFAETVLDKKWDWIHIPQVYGKQESGLGQAKFCTAWFEPAAFSQRDQLSQYVERFELGLAIATERGLAIATESEYPPESEQPGLEPGLLQDAAGALQAVIAVIDDGLAVAHERFWGWRGKPGATRVRYFWQQDGAEWVPGFGYGKERSQSEINNAVRDSTHGAMIDEDEVYRLLGASKPFARTGTHGTSVMDLACGASSEEQAREAAIRDTDIVCVALPRETTADTSGASLAFHVLNALRYILDRVDRLAPARDKGFGFVPVVVNLSYGRFAGPHDGSSMLERAIDELIEIRARDKKPNLAVVLPAGNSRLSRCHAKSKVPRKPRDDCTEFHWHILPDDATPSFMEIWPTPRKVAKFDVQVVTPCGVESAWVPSGQIVTWPSPTGPLCMVSNLDRVATGDGAMALVCVAPTIRRPWETAATVAPAGIWRVRVRNAGSAPLSVDAWIQRDDAVRGFPPRGRQSHFVDPNYERFDHAGREVETDPEDGPGTSYIKRDGTQNGIATGDRTIVVGGYRKSDGAAASYSSSGVGQEVRGPDALAVCERSAGRAGVLTAGTRSGGSKVAINGTSAAAPQVARWIAEQMVQGKYVGPEEVKSKAFEDDPPSKEPPGHGGTGRKPRPPEHRGGGGRMKREGHERDDS